MRVTLYGRPGCHLCDEARDALGELLDWRPGVELVEINIESDERLHAAFLERIPVVEVNGVIVSELMADQHELAARLHTVSP